MNLALLAIGLALDFSVGFLGARVGRRNPTTPWEFKAMVEQAQTALHYDGAPIAVVVDRPKGKHNLAEIQWEPLRQEYTLTLHVQHLSSGQKALQLTAAHEVCHAILEGDVLRGERIATEEQRDKTHKSVRKCAKTGRRKMRMR